MAVADQAVGQLALDVVLEGALGPDAEIGGVDDQSHGA
jgi:hypothetical protein